ncbi:beta-lactamase family protein, partial [bacterium]|nr:beta-lactamase family protein [bacterium]
MKRVILIFFLLISLTGRILGAELTPEAATQLTLLEKWVDETMRYYHIPGVSVGIVQDQELVWSKGFGLANIADAEPMRPAHLFRIASISKLFTSTAIMQLRDAGRVSLEDPIRKYLPWFEIQNEFEGTPEITIRHLLTHTSGLPREAAFPYWTDHVFPTTEQIKTTLPTQKMKYAPDTHFQYSNLGMALLGHVVATASGEAYAAYVENHIFKPLKMQDSQVLISEG